MNESEDAVLEELNDRQRRFVELVVLGRPAGRAYEEAGYDARGAVADQAASRLLRNVKVVSYREFLRNQARESSQMSLDEMVAYLTNVLRTPVGAVDQNHPLCQEYVHVQADDDEAEEEMVDLFGDTVSSKPKKIIRVKMVGKLDAGKMLIGLMGWNKPQQVELGADDALSALISGVRKSNP